MASVDHHRINLYRARVQWWARGIAAVVICFGTYLVIKRTLFASFAGWRLILNTWGDDLGESNSFFKGIGMIVVGTVLLFLAKPIARVVVSVPDTGCPQCGQPIDRSAKPERCTECGLWLGP